MERVCEEIVVVVAEDCDTREDVTLDVELDEIGLDVPVDCDKVVVVILDVELNEADLEVLVGCAALVAVPDRVLTVLKTVEEIAPVEVRLDSCEVLVMVENDPLLIST